MTANRLRRGHFVLLSFPFTDGTSSKVRPALIVASRVGGSSDFIALMVTGQHRPQAERWHVAVDESHPDFAETGLKHTSYIRCDKIYTFSGEMARAILGRASERIMGEVTTRLERILLLPRS